MPNAQHELLKKINIGWDIAEPIKHLSEHLHQLPPSLQTFYQFKERRLLCCPSVL